MKTAESIAQQQEMGESQALQSANTQDSGPAWLKPYHWQPGQSGNPAGRPKDTAADIARKIFENNPEIIYQAMSGTLKKGNAYAFKELADRGFGKMQDKIEVGVTDQLADLIAEARARKRDK